MEAFRSIDGDTIPLEIAKMKNHQELYENEKKKFEKKKKVNMKKKRKKKKRY